MNKVLTMLLTLLRFLFAIALLLLPSLSSAAGPTLKAQLISLSQQGRTAAPFAVDLKMKWDGTQILEGVMQFEIRDAGRVVMNYRSGPMALTAGEQTFRLLLPALTQVTYGNQLEVSMEFVTSKQTLHLEPSYILMPTQDKRSMVVAWCTSRQNLRNENFSIERSLRLETLVSTTISSDDYSSRTLATSMSHIVPEDLPSTPLGYCAYDMVVLAVDGLNGLRERQAQALNRWVHAGGSVCIFATGNLKSHQVDLLNALTDADAHELPFQANAEGRIAWMASNRGSNIHWFHTGLGRTVIVNGSAGNEFADSTAWRQVARFLWKTRGVASVDAVSISKLQGMIAPESVVETSTPTNVIPTLAETPIKQGTAGKIGKGFAPLPAPKTYPYSGVNVYQQPGSYNVQSTDLGSQLVNQLLPKTVRLIPFPVLATVLGLFVLAIGPLDYFVLGIFKRRRYTWVLFPVVTTGFTVLTVMMANHYLGQRDQRRSLIIVDVGKGGTVLRQNRYEMIFAGRNQTVTTDLKDALWAPLEHQEYYDGNYGNGYGRPGYRRNADNEGSTAISFQDVVPVHYQVKQGVRQWEPVLNRTFSMEGVASPFPFQWAALDDAVKKGKGVDACSQALTGSKSFPGDICIFRGGGSGMERAMYRGILPDSLLVALCNYQGEGLLKSLTRIAPTGGNNFEDLYLMDNSEFREKLVVAVMPVGDDVVMYRRLYHGF